MKGKCLVWAAIGVVLSVLGWSSPAAADICWTGPDVGEGACSLPAGHVAGCVAPFIVQDPSRDACPADNSAADGTGNYTLKTSTTTVVNVVSRQVSKAIRPGRAVATKTAEVLGSDPVFTQYASGNHYGFGLAAGDTGRGFNLWGNFTFTESDSDQARLVFDSKLNTSILGIDTSINDKIGAGIALSYEIFDNKTTYNDGDMSTKGYSFVPYIAMLVNEHLSVDLLVGYGLIDIDQRESVKTSSLDADKIFTQFNINGYHSIGNWNFTGTLSLLYANEKQDAYYIAYDASTIDANRVELGQFSCAAEVSYLFTSFEPYAAVAYENEYKYADPRAGTTYDHNGFLASLGARILMNEFITGELEANHAFGRSNMDEYSILANLRYSF